MVNPITGPGGLGSIGPDKLFAIPGATQALLSGETDNVAEVFAAVNKAGIAFDLLMEIRNKLLDAYQEIKQIRV